jgi:isoquinoline 1-oxidoreductase beta subunit
VAEDGKSAEAWVGSQAHDGARKAVAEVLGIDFKDVTYHSCYLGGGFGRRSMSDYVEEATHLSNAVKKPVKLVWSREDDLQYGAFRPISVQRMQAGVNDQGDIVAWSHQIVGTGDGLMSSGAKNPYYSITNQYIDLHNIEAGVRTKHWRSVGHGPNKYAIEGFIDEIARAVNKDPYQLRRQLLRNNPRELAVLDKVAEMCSWGSAEIPEGRARGMAFIERSGALVGGVAEISVDRASGKIRIHRFWCAMDAGVVVQPDNAIAQLEGGVNFGISSVLHESVTFKDGMVEQSNFHNYHIARMSDAPESIECYIIPSDEAPAGVGEASTPTVGGAVANAFLALTGKALYHMPFTAERVKEVLAV